MHGLWKLGVVVALVAIVSCGPDGSSTGTTGSTSAATTWWGNGVTTAPTGWDALGGQTFPTMYGFNPGGGTSTQTPVMGTGFYPETGHPLCCPATCPTNTTTTNQREADLRTLVNAYRVSNGLAQLSLDAKLDEVARAEVKHQYIHGYSGLTNPEGDTVSGRLTRVNVASISSTENQVMLDGTAQQIFDAMIADPVMKQNLLDAQADALGVGHSLKNGEGRTSVVINRTN